MLAAQLSELMHFLKHEGYIPYSAVEPHASGGGPWNKDAVTTSTLDVFSAEVSL